MTTPEYGAGQWCTRCDAKPLKTCREEGHPIRIPDPAPIPAPDAEQE